MTSNTSLSYCLSYLTNRSRYYSLVNVVVVAVTALSLFLLYTKMSFFYTIAANQVGIITNNNPSAEDLHYNLLGVEAVLEDDCARQQQDGQQLTINSLQQDHPCLIDAIRRRYLQIPAPPGIALNLNHPEVVDQSAIQSKIILPLLQNKTGGFFVECGAADGESGSNTLYMERYLNWEGILIEGNRKFYSQLMTRMRKAYALHVCLSLKPHPTTVYFHENSVAGKVEEGLDTSSYDSKKENLVILQCFPLYSILLAVGKIKVDYFSLDVEGSETQILKTVPWHRVDIKTLTVEVTSRNKSVVDALVHYMEMQGYKKVSLLDGPSYFDLVLVKL